MSLPRSLLALLLAFLVGSPLCCCAAGDCGGDPGPEPHSCCGASGDPESEDEAPGGSVCDCKSKDPRDVADRTFAPQPPVVPLPGGPIPTVEPAALTVAVARVADPLFSGIDPPRTLLARLSRWLI